MVTYLPVVSSCSKQMEEMKDIALCLHPLRNGTVVLKTIYHLSKTFINIIRWPKQKGTLTQQPSSTETKGAEFAAYNLLNKGAFLKDVVLSESVNLTV